MRTLATIGAAVLFVSGCSGRVNDGTAERKTLAERFFRGIYGCSPGVVVDDLAAENILISYPIFQAIFGQSALRGREAVKQLAENFCQTWADPQLTIDSMIAEGNNVVFLWSFRARNVGRLPGGDPATNSVHEWGGITLFSFDEDGKIIAEIGEESEPGPMQRVRSNRLRQ